jgi:anti-sigma regulatory factor (Ser/Thr protein kinase)
MQPLLVPGTLDSLSAIGQYVNAAALAAGLEKKVAYRLRLAVDEIATNIIIHGYEEAGQSGDVLVISEMDEKSLTITLEDTSAPFDPRNIGRPEHIDKPAHERPIGGLGVYLTFQNVDKYDYEYLNNRNRNIFIVKRPVEIG